MAGHIPNEIHSFIYFYWQPITTIAASVKRDSAHSFSSRESVDGRSLTNGRDRPRLSALGLFILQNTARCQTPKIPPICFCLCRLNAFFFSTISPHLENWTLKKMSFLILIQDYHQQQVVCLYLNISFSNCSLVDPILHTTQDFQVKRIHLETFWCFKLQLSSVGLTSKETEAELQLGLSCDRVEEERGTELKASLCCWPALETV